MVTEGLAVDPGPYQLERRVQGFQRRVLFGSRVRWSYTRRCHSGPLTRHHVAGRKGSLDYTCSIFMTWSWLCHWARAVWPVGHSHLIFSDNGSYAGTQVMGHCSNFPSQPQNARLEIAAFVGASATFLQVTFSASWGF